MPDKTPQEKRKATIAKNKKLKGEAGALFNKEIQRRVKAEAKLKAYEDLMKAGWSPKKD